MASFQAHPLGQAMSDVTYPCSRPWVWWWNNARLQGELDYRNPMEVEKAYYSDQESPLPAIAGQETG